MWLILCFCKIFVFRACKCFSCKDQFSSVLGKIAMISGLICYIYVFIYFVKILLFFIRNIMFCIVSFVRVDV